MDQTGSPTFGQKPTQYRRGGGELLRRLLFQSPQRRSERGRHRSCRSRDDRRRITAAEQPACSAEPPCAMVRAGCALGSLAYESDCRGGWLALAGGANGDSCSSVPAPWLGAHGISLVIRIAILAMLCLQIGCGQNVITPMSADALAPPPDVMNEVTTTRQSMSPAGASSSFNPASGGLDGAYRGFGRIVRNPGGTCQTGMPVHGMQVSGDQVHFGSFNGTIQSGGVVEMEYGRNWVIGRFDGPHFLGRWIAPACSYELTLNRES